MPIHLEMIENGHILWFHIEGAWQPAEIPAAKEKTHQFYRQAHHPVHALVDLRHATVNLPLITASRDVIGGERLPNSGQIAIVGVPFLLRMMAEPILRVAAHGEPITFFDTMEQAKAYLRRFISHDK